jgi:hypothetical protein
MTKPDTRQFTWNEDEESRQEEAFDQILNISEEHEIEALLTGGAQFANCASIRGVKPSDLTVAEFAAWKSKVVNKMLERLLWAEREAFDEILAERKDG